MSAAPTITTTTSIVVAVVPIKEPRIWRASGRTICFVCLRGHPKGTPAYAHPVCGHQAAGICVHTPHYHCKSCLRRGRIGLAFHCATCKKKWFSVENVCMNYEHASDDVATKEFLLNSYTRKTRDCITCMGIIRCECLPPGVFRDGGGIASLPITEDEEEKKESKEEKKVT